MNDFLQATIAFFLALTSFHAFMIARHLHDIDITLRMLAEKKDQEERNPWEDSE